jgi:hypothetical protein
MQRSKWDSRVLNFGAPRASKTTQYLLWPVLGYRLSAPLGRAKRRVNFIESAVLGLIRTGLTDMQRIAQLLGLAHELVAHICKKLASDRPPAIDEVMLITQDGKKMLEDSEVESTKQRTGWIFQDPWSGEIWRRFVNHLPTVPINGEIDGQLELDIGTEGHPFAIRPIVIEPRLISTTQPSAIDVLRSVMVIDERKMTGNLDDDSSDVIARYRDDELRKVTYIDSEPELMYCLTALVVETGIDSAGSWNIKDPFFPRLESMRLHKALSLRFEEYPQVPRRLANLLGIDASEKVANLQQILNRVEIAAEMEIKARFGTLPEEYGVLDRLLKLEIKLQQMFAAGGNADPEEVFTACGKLLERLMKRINRDFSPIPIARLLELKKGMRCGEILGRDTAVALRELGYLHVPKSLIVIDQGQLKNAMLYKQGEEFKGSLMQLVLAGLMTALALPKHPLKTLAMSESNLLDRIDEIAKRRNPSAHDSEIVSDLKSQIEKATSLAKDSFEIARLLLSGMKNINV